MVNTNMPKFLPPNEQDRKRWEKKYGCEQANSIFATATRLTTMTPEELMEDIFNFYKAIIDKE